MSEHSVVKALTSRTVWWLAILYFLALAAELGFIFFGPTLISEALHISNAKVGWVMGGTGLAGVVGMLVNGASSDRKQERIAHAVIPIVIMTVGLVISALVGHGIGVVLGFAILMFGFNAFLPVFWCLPAVLLSGTAAAGGIALINSIGNFAGFFAPNIVGIGKSMTGTYTGSLWMLAGFGVVCAAMILPVGRTAAFRRRAHG